MDPWGKNYSNENSAQDGYLDFNDLPYLDRSNSYQSTSMQQEPVSPWGNTYSNENSVQDGFFDFEMSNYNRTEPINQYPFLTPEMKEYMEQEQRILYRDQPLQPEKSVFKSNPEYFKYILESDPLNLTDQEKKDREITMTGIKNGWRNPNYPWILKLPYDKTCPVCGYLVMESEPVCIHDDERCRSVFHNICFKNQQVDEEDRRCPICNGTSDIKCLILKNFQKKITVPEYFKTSREGGSSMTNVFLYVILIIIIAYLLVKIVIEPKLNIQKVRFYTNEINYKQNI